jgi:hypothetical protein
MWFGAGRLSCDTVGYITPAGVITQYPTGGGLDWLSGITTGPDGNIWVVQLIASKIARIGTNPAATARPPSAEQELANLRTNIATLGSSLARARLEGLARTAKLSIPARWLSAGTLTFTLAVRGQTIAEGDESRCASGTTTIAITGPRRSRKRLASAPRLAVRLTASFAPTTTNARLNVSTVRTLRR